jgi:DNA-binding transcriptional LysR family regulator
MHISPLSRGRPKPIRTTRATRVSSPSSAWPHLPGRPYAAHRTNDWLGRLRLVAAGAGITTIPGPFLAALAPDVHAVHLTGAQEEKRRVSAMHLPGRTPAEAPAVLNALHLAAEELTA